VKKVGNEGWDFSTKLGEINLECFNETREKRKATNGSATAYASESKHKANSLAQR
jgi:hypothetical protein